MIYPYLSIEERLRRLETDLQNTRDTVLGFLPKDLKSLFKNYWHCKDSQQINEWMKSFLNKVMEVATPEGNPAKNEVLVYDQRPRVLCPLCGCGSHNVVLQEGFLLPDGLMMHLTGEKNARQCRVMEAIMPLTDDHFQAIQLAETKAQNEESERRKSVEKLYQVAFSDQPVLIDECLYGKCPRNEHELIWAEQRLRELGFQLVVEGRVTKYSIERQDFFVLADPRSNGEILFRAYRMPLPKRGRGKLIRTFSIQDKWKTDLNKKFEMRLTGTTG
jgi:hypothetical protein